MRILGLDPGSVHTGYGLVRRQGSRLVAELAGRVSCPRGMPLPERLGRIARDLGEILDRHRPDLAALESPFYHRNPRSLIALAQARGAILAVLALREVAVHEYSPAEVKSAVTGSGRADKGQVARMVRLTLSIGGTLGGSLAGPSLGRPSVGVVGGGAPNPGRPTVGEDMPEDATDALAVAICCAQRLRMDRLGGP